MLLLRLELDPHAHRRSADRPGVVVIPVGIQIHTQSIDRVNRADALDVQRLCGGVRAGEQRRAEKKLFIGNPHQANMP